MKCIGIIPARYASTRFPGKPLALINGKTMIRRVYEQATQAGHLSYVLIATDDTRIQEHIETFSGEVVMTSTSHRSGTERCLAALEMLMEKEQGTETFDVLINIQGDEPYIPPSIIDELAACFKDDEIKIATMIRRITSENELLDPNIVKVVIDKNRRAIYFSRTPVPYLRGVEQEDWLKVHTFYKHIGMYGYRVDTLSQLVALPPSPLEKAEVLEQLRWIENGFSVQTIVTDYDSLSVDVPNDLLKFTNIP
jgi:3-deoxy-manno-octulosonate cytidylyltransferase (CMP-KDO synthetase)